MSNESDIHDLSTEKIITVIYLYEYEESDETGLNVTPVSERHIVNIHINFKSGVPEIGDIAKPDIVLPGTTIGMNIPSVTQGAYRVTESGWEIFSNPDDAATHYNGVPFYNNETPLYWYQNNYWIAYYAQTSLGKTYSKSVPLSVANYHDLKKVMDDQDHHYYIDHRDVGYAPKIYINDYKTDDPATSQNGLDLLKNLIDLSYVVNNDADGNPQKISGGTLDGHMPMASRLRGGNNLEFFLRTNLDHTGTEWTPIANNTGECFSAMLHGDGHSISGLDHSLINHLCGHIYNLGVSGSFTSSGIAEEGDGYLENCWIKTTGTPASNTHPLFGTPTATSFSQVVNCYYQEDGETALYTPFTGDKNMAVKKPSSAFNNGEVAYNLNGFYLNKRYYEGKGTAEPATSAKPELTSGSSYVNGRYADGDFIYANGTIPSSPDERLITDTNGDPVLDTNGKQQYLPTWPDDYLFFGQTLNYGYVENVPYEIVPSAITATNRVYRAPAYFGNSTMRVAHFNPNAVFAKSMKDDETVVAYKGMTAIDFTGYNDVFNATNGEAKPYQQGLVSGQFYAPLLNDAGLTDFTNVDLTRNLLAYTGTSTAAATTTNDVIQSKLTDETYEDYVTDTYLTVEEAQDRKSPSVKGHWIQQSTESVSNYVATRDHFLVDKEVFNAPIAYTFDATSRMWYQRLPENYVGKKKEAGSGFIENGAGWEGISIPFKAEIVATDTKGEITHFYNEGDNWKGHEYWLREYKGQKDGTTVTADGIFTANFSKPEPSAADESEFDTKHYFNTFLWNYYYKNNDFDDKNSDKYPRTYYSESHDYVNYPRLASATPYIIGFPGERYYEFDLSGNFVPKTAKATTPAKLSAQVITFASAKKAKIGVSDTELEAGKESHDGYIFVPNYGNETLSSVAYILNTNDENVDKRGGSYDKVASDAVTVPFRPYFSKLASAREVTRSIIFSEDNSQLQVDDDREQIDEAYSLSIYAKRKKIVVESNLREITEVRIVNTAGITMATFTIEPGETVETRIINSGVYIVQTADARYTKKLAVK